MADVFVSYKTEDRDRVQEIVNAIESSGLSVFWDQKLNAGDEWFDVIVREVKAAKMTLGIWSSASVDERGMFNPNSRGKRFVEIEHDETPSGKLVPILLDKGRVPMTYRHIHAVDASNGFSQAVVDSLLARIGLVLELSGSHTPKVQFRTRLSATTMAGLALGFVAVGGASFVAGRASIPSASKPVLSNDEFDTARPSVDPVSISGSPSLVEPQAESEGSRSATNETSDETHRKLVHLGWQAGAVQLAEALKQFATEAEIPAETGTSSRVMMGQLLGELGISGINANQAGIDIANVIGDKISERSDSEAARFYYGWACVRSAMKVALAQGDVTDIDTQVRPLIEEVIVQSSLSVFSYAEQEEIIDDLIASPVETFTKCERKSVERFAGR